MKLTFLGTGAAEQYPAAFCTCANCRKAQARGGRNLRATAAAFLAPDCLIDFTHGGALQARRFGLPLESAQYLLVTHAHADHLDPQFLLWSRYMDPALLDEGLEGSLYSRASQIPILHVYGSAQVSAALHDDELEGEGDWLRMQVHPLDPGQAFEAGDMACVALRANHQDGTGRGLNYIIQQSGRTLLYALDTCWFPDESLQRISEFQYDLVIMDATYGVSPEHDEQHNNLALVERAYALFQEHELLNEGARFCISHISPHWNPIHDELAPMMAEKGITVPYDGLTIEV